MKRLIFILVLVVVAMTTRGQTALSNLKGSGLFSSGETFKTWATDYTLTNTTANTYTWEAKKDFPNTQSYTVSFTKVSGTQNVTVALYGKQFDSDSYTLITSGTSGNIVTTSTVTLTNTVPKRYRLFEVIITGANGSCVTTITSQSFKIWLE